MTAVDDAIAAAAAATGAQFVQVRDVVWPARPADDLIHPNAAGHAAIAQQVHEQLAQ